MAFIDEGAMTPDGIQDLQDFQIAIRGRLGYDPSKQADKGAFMGTSL